MNAILSRLNTVFVQHQRRLYLVGGSVRDQLLSRPSPDIDLATDATPREVQSLVRAIGPDAIYTVGERFGTIGIIVDGRRIEITTFRSEEYQPRSRKPRVRFGVSLEGDLARRDFTINAIAQDLSTGQLIDPFGGLTDLQEGIIRAVGNPAERFAEDPLRLMRAVRFMAELGFRIEPATRQAIMEWAAALEQISRERVAEEMNKILLSPSPGTGVRALVDLGLMAHIIPEMLEMRGMLQEGWHHKDVYEHMLLTLDNARHYREALLAEEDRLALMWAALLHDIGKPRTRGIIYECRRCGYTWGGEAPHRSHEPLLCPRCNGAEVERIVHFRWHEQVGAELARQILSRLRQESKFTERVGKLVLLHTRANSYTPDWTDAAVRRFIREAGDELDLLFALSRADITSQRPARVEAALARVNELEARCRDLTARENVKALTSPLNGHELMEMFGRPPGPWIREVKDYLLMQVIEGNLRTDDKVTAADMARRFVEEKGI